jgi:hypothetical protein
MPSCDNRAATYAFYHMAERLHLKPAPQIHIFYNVSQYLHVRSVCEDILGVRPGIILDNLFFPCIFCTL